MDWSDATARVRTLATHPVCAALRGLPGPPDVAVVGGTVRDLLLDRPHPDLDLCVATDPRAVATALRQAVGGSWFMLDEEFGVVRFTAADGEVVDMARRQGGSWEEDLRGRDLTINALGAVLAEGGRAAEDFAILDPTGGLADLRDGIVRATSLQALEADPLRALRVYRFAGALGFEIEPATRRWSAAMGERLGAVSWERIRDEAFKLLAAPVCGPYVAALADARLLTRVFPELSWLRGTVSIGHFDGFVHRIESLRALDRLLSALGPWTGEEREFLGRRFGETLSGGRPKLALGRAALLLHGLDPFRLGGPPDGGPRSRRGGVLAGICARLRLANAETRWLVGAERGMANFEDLRTARRVGGAALYRFFRDAGDAAPEVAVLGLAEYLAARDLTLEDDEGVLGLSHSLLSEAMEPTVSAPQEPLVRGDDLIAALGLARGPRVAELLEEIAEARAEGLIESADEAIAYARSLGR